MSTIRWDKSQARTACLHPLTPKGVLGVSFWWRSLCRRYLLSFRWIPLSQCKLIRCNFTAQDERRIWHCSSPACRNGGRCQATSAESLTGRTNHEKNRVGIKVSFFVCVSDFPNQSSSELLCCSEPAWFPRAACCRSRHLCLLSPVGDFTHSVE